MCPSTIRRSMIAEEDRHCREGEIHPHMVRERKGNANPYLRGSIRVGGNWPPGELLNYSGLEATRYENVANDQGSKFDWKHSTAIVLTISR